MLPKIDHPSYDLQLPSNNVKIRIRPLLTKEEKILLTAKESGSSYDIIAALKQVVTNCIITPGIDVDKLAIFDIEYAFLNIHKYGVSNIVKTAYTDREDQLQYDFDIDLSNVIVKYPNSSVEFFSIGFDQHKIELQYPPASLYSDKQFLDLQGQAMFERLVLAVIKSVDGETFNENTPEEQLTFVNNLPIAVHDQLKTFIAQIPTLFYEIKYTNSKGTERSIVLSSLSDFFLF